jgi:hypothetical protein
MANHITINGQTYFSVEQMPADVRQQYEAAMRLLPQNAGEFADAVAGGDVNISTTGSDPAGHRTFKTVTKMTSHRILVNGKEFARWEDVPAEARGAFHSAAGVNPKLPLASGAKVVTGTTRVANAYQLNYTSSSTISLSLSTLIVLLILVLLLGVGVGYLLH